jgi:hypothetical protein
MIKDRLSWTDVLVLALVLALLSGALIAATTELDEKARRIACAGNLREIGRAMVLYANDNKGWYPRTVYDIDHAEKVKFFTHWRARDPFGADGPEPNDVTAAPYLLLRTQTMQPSAFRCPGSNAKPFRFGLSAASQRLIPGQSGVTDPVSADAQKQTAEERRQHEALPDEAALATDPIAREPRDLSNFPGPEYLGYSFANPYPTRTAIGAGFQFSAMHYSIKVLAADLNPGGEATVAAQCDGMPPAEQQASPYVPFAKNPWKFTDAQRAANSPSHQGFGQNVLLDGGAVVWQPTPFVGMPHPDVKGTTERWDNIYRRFLDGVDPAERGDPIVGPPVDQYDAVLLPTAPQAK